jgi:exodeoxyribonuclease V alpha subunit
MGLFQKGDELNYGKHPCPKIDFEKALEWVQKKTKIELSENQIKALQIAVQAKVMVITGGPGVGKTTLVNSIIQVLRAKKMKIALCAPTGRAAKRLSETTGLEAKTIHRLLQVQSGHRRLSCTTKTIRLKAMYSSLTKPA